jgi:amidase
MGIHPLESRTMAGQELHYRSATWLAGQIRTGALSCREVMQAHLNQMARVNPKVNAIVTFVGNDRALAMADEADAAVSRSLKKGGRPLGPLHGLPHGVKDLVDTEGMRTTKGSPIYKDRVPDRDALIVERVKAAGALVIGKTNTPEFGAGSQTFNAVFGRTLNPYDLSRTCGGSSGGAAVSLATGMLPIADGSDLGGSLRNPASFCNIVGFRPSPGRVPVWPTEMGWWTLSVLGPMARSVQDVALLLSAMAGPDARAPISLGDAGFGFRTPLARSFKGVRVALTPNLGRYPVDHEVAAIVAGQRRALESLGCIVEDAHPDFEGVDEAFHILRAWKFSEDHGQELKEHRSLMKDTVIWNTEEGLKLTGADVARAEVLRTKALHRLREFMERYEYLALPAAAVLPFPVDQPYPTEINGVKMANYIQWMGVCYAITVTGHPAISVPAGFTAGGLPVGLQLVGRHHADFSVLQLAHAFEGATQVGMRRPGVAV